MSFKHKTDLLIWSIMFFVVSLLVVSLLVMPETYPEDEFDWSVRQGWWLDFNCQGPSVIQAASNKPFTFQLRNTEAEHPGVQSPVPLDYDHDEYFYLEEQFDCGTWQLIKGSDVSMILTSDTSFHITRYATKYRVSSVLVITMILTVVSWIILFISIDLRSAKHTETESDTTE